MKKVINISVHQLVDFLLRKGDIDTRVFNSGTMEEGTEIHKKYQHQQKSNYFSEVDLKTTISLLEFDILLHGRADGVIIDKEITIDEIKSTNSNLDVFFEQNEQWHLGQAECYAYMYAKEHKISNIFVNLTYISQINRKTLTKTYEYHFNDLEQIVYGYVNRYFDFYKLIQDRIIKKNKSIKSLVFPFSLRKGQSEIIKNSEETIANHKISFLQASTGLGKTIGIVFGALKGSTKTPVDKFFFLTAKNSGFKSAEDCLDKLRETGLEFISSQIVAKEKMCLNKNHNCNPDDCPFAVDYYDKLNSVLVYMIKSFNDFTAERIIGIASKFKMCPFELSLDLSLNSDFIIMDYNYVYNPTSYLKRFFDAPDKTYNLVALVDEAHNLIDRSRDMYSAQLNYFDFKKAKKSYKDIKNKVFVEILKNLTLDFKGFKNFEFESDYVGLEKIDDDFILHLTKYQDSIRDYRKKHLKYKNNDDKDFSLAVFQFLEIFKLVGNNYKIFVKRDDENFFITLYCMDASSYLLERTSKLGSSIFFSGTLMPIKYYQKSILGSDTYDYLNIDSPFSNKNLKVLVNNTVSTRYKNRENTLTLICDYIRIFCSKKIGNYIVFVPSFSYLEKLKNVLKIDDSIDVIYQKNRMTNQEKDIFLEHFVNNPTKTTLAVCVLGGSFSEGIDLPEDRLIGLVVIGVGLPSISYENDLIKEYYSSIGLDGFTYAYTNPGINKVMQAVGRLIRTENDRGIALLIDDRYFYKNYLELYKTIWSNNKKVIDIKSLESEINSFYK